MQLKLAALTVITGLLVASVLAAPLPVRPLILYFVHAANLSVTCA